MAPFFYHKDTTMDILNLVQYDDAFDYTLKHPVTNEETDVVFKLRSSNNADARKVSLKSIQAAKNSKLTGKASPVEKDLDLEYERIATCIVGWSDTFTNHGEPFPYNKENVAKVVREDWIYSQINSFVNDIENFTKA